MSELPYILRMTTVSEAEWLADVLTQAFGYYNGDFKAIRLNVRGKCDEHDTAYLRIYTQALVDVKKGAIDLGK